MAREILLLTELRKQRIGPIALSCLCTSVLFAAALFGQPDEDAPSWRLGQPRFSSLEFHAGPKGPAVRQRFLGQLRFEAAPRSATPESLTFPRIRSITEVGLLDERLSLKLHFNVSPASVELLDYVAEARLLPGFVFGMGQAKIPLTRHRVASVSRLTFADWSRAARFFGGERQLGLFARQQMRPGKQVRPEWALGLYSGTNARSAFEVGPSTLFDVAQPNPSDLRDPSAPAEIHPEIAGRVGLRVGRDDFGTDSDRRGGPPRVHLATGFSFDADPVLGRDYALRVAPEVLAKWAHLSFSSQGYLAWFERDAGAIVFAASGLNVQTAWRFLPYLEAAARHARVQFSEAFQRVARGFAGGGSAAGALERFDETTGALSFYAFDHQLKAVSDVSVRWQQIAGATLQDELFRLQLQIAF